MSDVREKRRRLRSQRSIHHVHYNLPRSEEVLAKPLVMPMDPSEIQAYDRQVAGHTDGKDTKYLGLLQCSNGTILKPIIKAAQRREMDFYERLSNSSHGDLVELRKLVPRYYGRQLYTYNGHQQEYIILTDLMQKMLEPCIMDVKIGKRTWDPLATAEKIENEKTKYALCKQEYGFCIPGFQVYRLASGQFHKYDKDYGKKLHGKMVTEAIKKYLNGMCGTVSRALVLEMLATLWQIQQWARSQRSLKVYSASLLLAYDAAKLRSIWEQDGTLASQLLNNNGPKITRRRSIHSTHSPSTGSNFSGQISAKGPVYKKVNSVPLSSMTLAQASFCPLPSINSPWTEVLERVNQNHSFEHNYEEKLCKIKLNFKATLDEMCSDTPNAHPWVTVKIIDFAHAFFNEEDDQTTDDNFSEGIDNFVKIFESFISETSDQVV